MIKPAVIEDLILDFGGFAVDIYTTILSPI